MCYKATDFFICVVDCVAKSETISQEHRSEQNGEVVKCGEGPESRERG